MPEMLVLFKSQIEIRFLSMHNSNNCSISNNWAYISHTHTHIRRPRNRIITQYYTLGLSVFVHFLATNSSCNIKSVALLWVFFLFYFTHIIYSSNQKSIAPNEMKWGKTYKTCMHARTETVVAFICISIKIQNGIEWNTPLVLFTKTLVTRMELHQLKTHTANKK